MTCDIFEIFIFIMQVSPTLQFTIDDDNWNTTSRENTYKSHKTRKRDCNGCDTLKLNDAVTRGTIHTEIRKPGTPGMESIEVALKRLETVPGGRARSHIGGFDRGFASEKLITHLINSNTGFLIIHNQHPGGNPFHTTNEEDSYRISDDANLGPVIVKAEKQVPSTGAHVGKVVAVGVRSQAQRKSDKALKTTVLRFTTNRKHLPELSNTLLLKKKSAPRSGERPLFFPQKILPPIDDQPEHEDDSTDDEMEKSDDNACVDPESTGDPRQSPDLLRVQRVSSATARVMPAVATSAMPAAATSAMPAAATSDVSRTDNVSTVAKAVNLPTPCTSAVMTGKIDLETLHSEFENNEDRIDEPTLLSHENQYECEPEVIEQRVDATIQSVETLLSTMCTPLTAGQRSFDWFTMRKYIATGTTMGGMMKLTPARHMLYAKTPPDTIPDNAIIFGRLMKSWFYASNSSKSVYATGMYKGTLNEPAVVEQVADFCDVLNVFDIGLVRSKECPYLGVSADGICVIKRGTKTILASLEIKTRVNTQTETQAWDTKAKLSLGTFPVAGVGECTVGDSLWFSSAIPINHRAQIMHQAAVIDLQFVLYCVATTTSVVYSILVRIPPNARQLWINSAKTYAHLFEWIHQSTENLIRPDFVTKDQFLTVSTWHPIWWTMLQKVLLEGPLYPIFSAR